MYDFGETTEGTLYYAREYVNGFSLQDLVIISGSQPTARVVHILYEICGSLAEAHGSDLIHRDLTPSNIMLCERGGICDVVKVLDFGLFKGLQSDEKSLPSMTKDLVGTALYMAPELVTDATSYSASSDLYAVGAIGHYLLTSQPVFEATSAVQICAMHLHDEPVRPSERGEQTIPSDLETLVMACLATKPQDRPDSAEALSDELTRCADFGAWTEEQAQQWWSEHRDKLPTEEQQAFDVSPSKTQIMVDMNERARFQRASAAES